MQDEYRTKASSKIQMENKFNIKKVQLVDSLRAQIQEFQSEFQDSLLKDKQEVMNLKAKIISLQKLVESKNSIILEQEILISQLKLSLDQFEKQKCYGPVQSIDQEILVQLQLELDDAQSLISKLRAKANRLCSYLVCLRLYNSDLGMKIQQDNYDYNLLFMPKLPDHSHLINALQESERTLKQQVEQLVYLQFQLREVKLKNVEEENLQLSKENKNLKRSFQKFNVTQNIDAGKQQSLIEQLQEQLTDQQLLIQDYYYKVKQFESQNQCKQLNDFILKKRKSKNLQPVFNLELIRRKLTLDVSRDSSIHTSVERRIHSKTQQYKY